MPVPAQFSLSKDTTVILILLLLIFYLFAIISVITFGQNDPIHFGSLHMAMVSLFRMSTMEDWTDMSKQDFPEQDPDEKGPGSSAGPAIREAMVPMHKPRLHNAYYGR